MKILKSIEQEAFELPPVLNSAERKRDFDFPAAILQIAAELRTPANQLCFLLSCGYFRATHRFYPVQTFRPRDISHVAERTGITIEAVRLAEYDKQTMARHQALILDFYGFRPFKPHGQAILVEEIARLVRSQLKPRLIFSRSVETLVREKVEVPGYFRLAVLILRTINSHWMDELQHRQQRHHCGRPSEQTVYAGVIAIGCTIGIRKMAKISHPISESALEHTVNWYFSLDNIIAANDRLLQFMDRLELPNLMRRSADRLHTCSDGQKFEVRADSLNANYSYKYVGLKLDWANLAV
jgi:hypothetical protein